MSECAERDKCRMGLPVASTSGHSCLGCKVTMHAICGRDSGLPESSSCPRICSTCHDKGLRPTDVTSRDNMSVENLDEEEDEVMNLIGDEEGDVVTPAEPRGSSRRRAVAEPSKDANETAPAQKKQKRKRLSLSEQLDVIRHKRSGISTQSLATRYECSRSAIDNIYSRRAAIEKNVVNLSQKAAAQPRFPRVDACLMEVFERMRQAGLPITAETLRVQTEKIRDELLTLPETSTQERARLQGFKASLKYVRRFVARTGLKSVRLHGEAGSVDHGKTRERMGEIREISALYDADCILNGDETGIFFRLLPKVSYVLPGEKKSVRGVKGMKAKDRITLITCTNATGTLKIPLSAIGNSAAPRCFRIRPPPMHYQSQKNAWADSKRFLTWYQKVFLPAVRKFTSRKVLLLLDNAGSHDEESLKDPRGQVHVEFYPPNCTSVHQPMDMGIIAAVKVRYRHILLRRTADVLDTREELRELYKNRTSGTRGLSEGYQAHVLDALEILQDCWSEVTAETIAKCWLKARTLSPGISEEIRQRYNLNASASNLRPSPVLEEDFERIISLIENLDISGHLQFAESEADVRDWALLEELQDVEQACRNDAMEDAVNVSELVCTSVRAAEDNGLEGGAAGTNDDAVDSEPKDVPRMLELSRMFADLEQLALDCDVPGASRGLRIAKHDFLKVQRERTSTRNRQAVIGDYFEKKQSSNF